MNYTKEQLEAVIKDQLHADMKPLASDALKWREIAEILESYARHPNQCGVYYNRPCDCGFIATLKACREAKGGGG